MTHRASGSRPRIGFFGAGSIGGYLGIRLSESGTPVVLVGREDLVRDRALLEAVDLEGELHRPGPDLSVSDDVNALSAVDACVVTVKAGDTLAAGRILAPVLQRSAVVISLQNGIRNAAHLRAGGIAQAIIPGMVTFNVRREGPTFRKATSGPILLGAGAGVSVVESFAGAGEPFGLHGNMEGVLVGKLLINLNNGLCTLSGLSIRESLRSADMRFAYAMALKEGLRVVRRAGHPVQRIGALSPELIWRALLLPDFLFSRVARSMLTVDAAARSSTLQDLERGRLTEIDHLNGEIATLGAESGIPAPVNRWIASEVHRLEKAGLPPPYLRPAEIRAAIVAVDH